MCLLVCMQITSWHTKEIHMRQFSVREICVRWLTASMGLWQYRCPLWWKAIGVLGFDSRQGLGIFLFTTASRTALGPTQPPIQWVPGALTLGYSSRGVKLTIHLHVVLRSRMRGAIPPLTQYAFMAWCFVKHRNNFTYYLLLWWKVITLPIVNMTQIQSEWY
jgi:hypothetical protein